MRIERSIRFTNQIFLNNESNKYQNTGFYYRADRYCEVRCKKGRAYEFG